MAQTSVNVANAALAQTFNVATPAGVSGIYVPSVELFFYKASTSFEVELTIVEITNGLPDVTKPIAGAKAQLSANNVLVSTDGSAGSTFVFPQLVFLQSSTTYALVIRGLGATPDYQLWTATTGDVDVSTNQPITANLLSGTLYYAKSSTAWAQIAGEDIKYIINRCQFNVSNTAYVGMKNANNEIFTLGNTQFMSGPIDVRAGDDVWGLTFTSNNYVANTQQYGKVVKYDVSNQLLYCKNSTGNFANGDSIQIVRGSAEGSLANSGSLIAISTIASMYDATINGAVIKIGNPSDSDTSIGFSFLGTIQAPNGAYILESTWNAVPQQTENEFSDQARYALSRSDEKTYLGGNSSIHVRATMSSNTDFLSPIIDTGEHTVVGYNNLINNSIDGEVGDLGASWTRYLSEVVTLADGMDAETLNVWLDAYRPAGTNLYVFAKIWNNEDPNQFSSNPWSLLQQTSNIGVYSDPNNTEDYREYEYNFQNSLLANTDSNYSASMAYQPLSAGQAQTVQYQSTTGSGVYYGFKSFAIKVILTTEDDGSQYPRLTDVRAIALML